MNVSTVACDRSQTAYDPAVPPVLAVEPGSVVTFETHDARAGALLDRPTSVPFRLPLPTPGAGNPVTGPVFVHNAHPGDGLLVDILAIDCAAIGWCGGHAHVGPVPIGRVPEPVGRTCRVSAEGIEFAPDIVLPLRPMVGCLGTAPPEGVGTHLAGPHGGNMDQPIVRAGVSVLLPVYVEGALLSAGDVHASQGDGELSGVGLEVPATVSVRVNVAPAAAPRWPWVLTPDVVAVLTVAGTFAEAVSIAVDEAMRLLESTRSLVPGDALALLSVCADIRVGGAWGGSQVSARLELPRSLAAIPAGLRTEVSS
ncbi:acetamidase/formamidase family protein [Dactylosporangium sucinum]|uniref:Acetamidase n=1 Tax=Dactylosporangium sucinum TaxID=1424081 RepID=A0A917U6C5_9ACTN|nr:acetamidase/formamidase family protein [Dactylosporangium sucinum]GGM61859.1 acetamidase [Dactylosporangium sucinum]